MFKIKIFLTFVLSVFTMTACGQNYYNDGNYTAKSSNDDHEQYGVVKLTLKDQKIIDCTYESFTKDGEIKGDDYGKKHHNNNKGYYEKAQLAIKQLPEYSKQLLEKQSIGDVDSITGATIAYDQFVECVDKILDEAKMNKEQVEAYLKDHPELGK